VVAGSRPELPIGNQEPPTRPLADIPASLHALPELNAIIRDCWQQRDHRRPAARHVHARLRSLAAKHGLLLLPDVEGEGREV
jgi:hypothetical protein